MVNKNIFIKKILLFLLLITFYSCGSKNNHSLILLHTAFKNWYTQNHKIDININNTGFHYYNNFYDKNKFNEYIKDLQKFELELSQINITKLSSDNKDIYLVINDLIQNLLIVNDNIDNFLITDVFLYDFYYSLYNVIEDPQLKMNDKIELLFDNLEKMNNSINIVIKENINVYTSDKSNYLKDVEVLNNYINYIPLKLNSDISTLDSLDNVF